MQINKSEKYKFTADQLQFIQKNKCTECKFFSTDTEYWCNDWTCIKLKETKND